MQAHKQNSLPNTVSLGIETPLCKKKHTTISRLFHGKPPPPQRQETFTEIPLDPKMKNNPSYHSDPNLLAVEDEPAKSQSKKKVWKWPFPRNKGNKELPEVDSHNVQHISIHNVVRNFPE